MKQYLWLFLLVFTVITGGYFLWSWSLLPAGERFIYQIDDPYIHMAIAKNFALNGVWSINATGFDSASSSILFTLVLTFLIKLFGVWEFYPLLLNVVFGYLTVYWVYRYFKDFYGATELKWSIVLLLPFSYLYAMVLISMEHTIHMFLMTLAIYCIKENMNSGFQRKSFLKLLVVVFFISVVRFESMFFTAALAFALFLRKDIIKGGVVLLVGFSAIIIFGVISVKNGGFFFPNSVLIKSSIPGGINIFEKFFLMFKQGILLNTSFYKCLFFPFIIIACFLYKKYLKDKNALRDILKNETLIITIVSMATVHSLFAMLKYRYENYLMLSILLIIIPMIAQFFKNFSFKKIEFKGDNIIMLTSVFVIIAVSIYRFQYLHKASIVSSKNIYEQQVEISRFLGKYYKGEKVAANDIGAISFYSGVKLFDIVGLGSTEVAKFKLENKNLEREEYLVKLHDFLAGYTKAHHYRIAVIYPEWFPNKTPSNWIPVASWTISGNKGAAIDRVVFYALNKEDVKPLQQNLMHFDLNKNVKEWFYILK